MEKSLEKKKRVYRVECWEHIAVFRDIEADTEEEALEKLRYIVENTDEIDVAEEGEVGDIGYEIVGEVK